MTVSQALRLHVQRSKRVASATRLTPSQIERNIFLQSQERLIGKKQWMRTPEMEWSFLLTSMQSPTSELNTASGPSGSLFSAESLRETLLIENEGLSGETVVVSEPVSAVIEVASSTMEPEPLFESDLIYPKGMLFLDRALMIPDLHPVTGQLDERLKLPVRAISWSIHKQVKRADGTTGPGVVLIPYVDYQGRSDFSKLLLELSQEDDAFKTMAGDIDDLDAMVKHQELMPVDFLPWAFGAPWQQVDEWAKKDAGVTGLIPSVSIIRLFFLSLMRFAWQEIVKERREAPDRPIRREAERQFKRALDQGICVLRLRKEIEYQDGGREGTPLSYRVVVRGHWRRQWYATLGPVEAPDSHRLIWIHPHIRGDVSLPLVEKPKVTVIAR